MLFVVALVLAGAAIAALAPWLLTRGHWQARLPRIALALWHGAMGSSLLCFAAAMILAIVLAAVGAAGGDTGGIVATVAGWTALLGLGAVIVIVASGADGAFDAGAATLRSLVATPHDAATLPDGTRLLTYDLDKPFACAFPGRVATVVVTQGMRDLLTPAQLRAVIEHERAHVRYRHDIAMGLARLSTGCFPTARPSRALLRITRLLIELIADDAAARRAGAVHLANALTAVSTATGDAAMHVRAERLAARRWAPARLLGPVPAVLEAR